MNMDNNDNQNVAGLPSLPINNEAFPISTDFYKTAFQFQQIMMIYESAIKQIETKLEILSKEINVNKKRNPIQNIKTRIKSPESIVQKLEKKHFPVNFDSMITNLNDIAGVRVVCPYISDIYSVKEMLLKQPDIKLVAENDYIECPKTSGYRSYHIVVEVPVYLSKTEHNVKVEIQLRTIAMDFWASLEHQLHYKNPEEVPESIRRELFRVAETIAMTDREMEEIAFELQALDN